jgi:hypothetical protein
VGVFFNAKELNMSQTMTSKVESAQAAFGYSEGQEFRAIAPTDTTGPAVAGHAVVYEQEVNRGGWYREVIKRGALDGTDLTDVLFFIAHMDRKIPLARSRRNTPDSTMQLEVDYEGLAYHAGLDTENNTESRALYSAVERRDISGMSYAMYVKEERWSDLDTDLPLREILAIDRITEISALANPQYDGTSITARDKALDSADKRALDNARSTLDNEKRAGQDGELELAKAKLALT